MKKEQNFATLDMEDTIKARKEIIITPTLGMHVFHEAVYNGHELLKIVGIRETQIELEGDYSGGTHNVVGKEWFPIKGAFLLRKACTESLRQGGCQLPNVHCGFPECEPYLSNYGHYINGKLVEKVEIIE